MTLPILYRVVIGAGLTRLTVGPALLRRGAGGRPEAAGRAGTGGTKGRYVADAVATMAREGIETVDVRPEVERRWPRRIRRRSRPYYQNDDGVNVVMWPGNTAGYRLRTRRFRASAFHVVRGRR